MTVCAAKTRSGTLCQRPAGWGTDHVGIGRCKLHGGATPVKTGRYSVVKRQALQEKMQQYYNDPSAGDLRSELALLRALLQDYLDRLDEHTDYTQGEIGRIYGMVDSIGHLVERIAKILATTALTQAELQLLQVTMIDALSEFVPDPERQRAFVSRVFGTLRGGARSDTSILSTVADDADISA